MLYNIKKKTIYYIIYKYTHVYNVYCCWYLLIGGLCLDSWWIISCWPAPPAGVTLRRPSLTHYAALTAKDGHARVPVAHAAPLSTELKWPMVSMHSRNKCCKMLFPKDPAWICIILSEPNSRIIRNWVISPLPHTGAMIAMLQLKSLISHSNHFKYLLQSS